MGPTKSIEGLMVWGIDNIEPDTLLQAARTARLPFVPTPVALMPDAHVGFGSTVGSVIPTQGAIIPSAIGVDIGCGMIASQTTLRAEDLPDSLAALMPLIEQRIPAGVGKGHDPRERFDLDFRYQTDYGELGLPRTTLEGKQRETAACQFGTLGSGNHFAEVCLDERGVVWTVLHSGSRGIGNQLATAHINGAKGLMKRYFVKLEDPDLAYLVEGTPEFDAYIADMLWAQRYAMGSRARMAEALNRSLFEVAGQGDVVTTINCHHNFTQREHHMGRNLWVTRKGAIRAAQGDLGVIPGSMGTRSYIVRGLAHPASYTSCSHGAGRRMSRGKAKAQLTVDSLAEAMEGKVWNATGREGEERDKVLAAVLDEHPAAYKDIDVVMDAQGDLCEPLHTLSQVFNYKGA